MKNQRKTVKRTVAGDIGRAVRDKPDEPTRAENTSLPEVGKEKFLPLGRD